MSLFLIINGQSRTLEDLSSPATLAQVVAGLDLKGDRIAVEHNGNLAPRNTWSGTAVGPGDRLEVVHFVGGGSGVEDLRREIDVPGT